jgi:hypothetical protein
MTSAISAGWAARASSVVSPSAAMRGRAGGIGRPGGEDPSSASSVIALVLPVAGKVLLGFLVYRVT